MVKKKLLLTTVLSSLILLPMSQANAFFRPSPERMMSMMDKDENKTLSKDEMVDFMINRRGLEKTQAETMFSCLDSNQDDEVNLDEFKSMMDVRKSIQKSGSC